MSRRFVLPSLLLLCFASGLSAQAPPPDPAGSGAHLPNPAAIAPMPRGFIRLGPDLVSGGIPTREGLESLRKAGFRTILNLQMDGERGVAEEEGMATPLGYRYLRVPVTAANLDAAKVDAFRKIVKEPANRPLIVHCAGAQRVGMMFAILAALDEGKSLDEAERIGQGAGMTRGDLKAAFRAFVENARKK